MSLNQVARGWFGSCVMASNESRQPRQREMRIQRIRIMCSPHPNVNVSFAVAFHLSCAYKSTLRKLKG